MEKSSKNLARQQNLKKAREKKIFEVRCKKILENYQLRYTDYEKKIILRVYIKYKLDNILDDDDDDDQGAIKFASYYTGVSEKTLKDWIVRSGIYDKNLEVKLPEYIAPYQDQICKRKIPDDLKNDLQNLLTEKGKIGIPVNSTLIRSWLEEKHNIKCGKITVWKALKRFNIKYMNIINADSRKNSEQNLMLKKDFLHKYMKYVDSINRQSKDIVFLDESYVVQNHCRGKTWTHDQTFEHFNKKSEKEQEFAFSEQ